jgi:hypothetical protein
MQNAVAYLGRMANRAVARLASLESDRFLLWLFLVALLIRVLAVLALRHVNEPPGRSIGQDGIDFDHFGRALAQGRGFVRDNGIPTAFRAPGFPAFLAVVYAASNRSYSVAYLSLCLLGATACLLAYLLAKEAVEESTARVAGVLCALYAPAIYLCTVWASEALFIPCFALAVWLLMVYVRTGSHRILGGAGLALGWSVLVRPFALLCLPLWVGFLLLKTGRRAFACCILIVSCLFPISVWTARNYFVLHAFVPVTTNGGSTFYGSNNDIVLLTPKYMGGWVTTRMLPSRNIVDAASNEVVRDHIEWGLGIHWLRAHIPAIPLLTIMKLGRLMLPEVDTNNEKYSVVSVVGWLPFFVLWIAGVRRVLSCGALPPPWLILHLTFAATVFTAIVFWGHPRFRDANAPILMVYAAYGAEWLINRRHVLSTHVPSSETTHPIRRLAQTEDRCLSVIIPSFNEEHTLASVVESVIKLDNLLEVLIIDDCSSDGTPAVIEKLMSQHSIVRSLRLPSNSGKTAALKLGFAECRGDVVIVQDADLEYSPSDIPHVIDPILRQKADVVYGSRFLIPKTGGGYLQHYFANRCLTFLSNLFTNLNLTDVETCYKAFRGQIIRSMVINSKGFGFEIEVTAKIAKLDCSIREVPISYCGRTYEQGKKIGFKDGVAALWYILKYNVFCSRRGSFVIMPDSHTMGNETTLQAVKP